MNIREYFERGPEAWKIWKAAQKGIVSLIGVDFKGPCLAKFDLSGCLFDDCKFRDVKFDGCDFRNAKFIRTCVIKECHFSGCKMTAIDANGVRFDEVVFHEVIAIGANISSADINNCIFKESNFDKILARYTHVNNTSMRSSSFNNGDFYRCEIRKSNISQSTFSGSDMTGSTWSVVDGRQSVFIKCNFASAEMHRFHGFQSNFKSSHWTNSILKTSDFRRANFEDCKMDGSTVRGCSFGSATMPFMKWINFSVADCDLRRAEISDSTFENGKIKDCRIYGLAAWGVKFSQVEQSDLDISSKRDISIKCISVEYGIVISHFLHNESIKKYFETLSDKVVLILGRFTPSRKVFLEIIRYELKNAGYVPVLFDFDKPDTKDLTETVLALALSSRAICADLSDPRCIPHELAVIAPNVTAIIHTLIETGHEPYAMFEDLLGRYRVIRRPLIYGDAEQLRGHCTAMIACL